MTVRDTSSLIARVQQGDANALDELLERYRPRLRHWARRRLPAWSRSLADTDDIVQDVLIRTVQRLPAFQSRGDAGFELYLRRILVNRIREEIRRDKPRSMTHTALAPDVPSVVPSPFDDAVASERRQRYEAALATLDEDDRLAIVGRFELGYSFPELADLLAKRSADAARKHTERAVLLLAEAMGAPRVE
jgi:RNA polymerase sigma-70 factor (ECF subfamily)